ncbi:ketopantoate reductase family protein [Parageobacillus thermoglucosidasius]|uniref:ketopantoate reductase family protein n=1 Tax=Parageobacillus thermoglucosidasius TaxID=1426 RepID=UPI000E13ECD8|nr:ketopantoate reductase family protein [Parageobacillus thermoglucosidasius]MED4902998.1 ketopantoate reductase family protein [Parageobacillus thermoglucosidasius]MED4915209.1 ketopantoate reductase family protein [Parageobacillus thermoglucosidasius]MED4945902.1 ketopantoate reductase family protein [Parageobacillus thermoglucosidasius]MED4981730.1 ketopantoate reductase family protein [Parageobacillus thermoglucosidasius]RDE28774.1 ketopantoate reductase family protein [Parageobacillus th
MRILVIGAGAVGGYFGGRLLEKGVDVTFLVRERRKKQLQERGLVIHSVHGDAVLKPKLLVTGEKADPFDVIIFSNKAYHLPEAIRDAKPYAGAKTIILPLLNGMAHMNMLWNEFGKENVLGGLCFIETTLNEHGEIVQTSASHDVRFGEWSGERTERIMALEQLFSGCNARFRSSEKIVTDMWNKYLFITAMSGVTTLFRAPVGPIRSGKYGQEIIYGLLKEIAAVMRAHGAPIADDIEEQQLAQFNRIEAAMKSSMQRDMEKRQLIEADHLQGYLLSLAEQYNIATPLLKMVYHNLKIYEANRS